ncbi:MAG: hypothetical protein ABMA64_09775 [Myxococcota bacterium]
MSLFEWLGESANPGSAGRLDVHGDGPIRTVWIGFAVLRFLFTVGLFVAVGVGAAVAAADLRVGLAAAAGYLLYLFLGYFVRPKPDLSNLGLFGGLIDHPFRWSDDWNRSLLFWSVVLLPGYVLARPVAEVFAWVAGEARGQ